MVQIKSIFIDANYFCGFNNRRDTLHEKSKQVFKILRQQEHTLYTSNFIIAEALTVLSQRAGKEVGLKFGQDIFGIFSPIKILRTDKKTDLESFNIFKKIKSKDISFVDATNLALMQKYKISYFLTFDQQLLKIAKKFNIQTLN